MMRLNKNLVYGCIALMLYVFAQVSINYYELIYVPFLSFIIYTFLGTILSFFVRKNPDIIAVLLLVPFISLLFWYISLEMEGIFIGSLIVNAVGYYLPLFILLYRLKFLKDDSAL